MSEVHFSLFELQAGSKQRNPIDLAELLRECLEKQTPVYVYVDYPILLGLSDWSNGPFVESEAHRAVAVSGFLRISNDNLTKASIQVDPANPEKALNTDRDITRVSFDTKATLLGENNGGLKSFTDGFWVLKETPVTQPLGEWIIFESDLHGLNCFIESAKPKFLNDPERGFISVADVIKRIQETTGKTRQEAATELSLLHEENDFPPLVTWAKEGLTELTDFTDGPLRIAQALADVAVGKSTQKSEELLVAGGFDEKQIFPILQAMDARITRRDVGAAEGTLIKNGWYLLDGAAAILAWEQWPETEGNHKWAQIRYYQKYPDTPPPVENGQIWERGYLNLLRHEAERKYQSAIDVLLAAQKLTLFDPDTKTSTSDPRGAYIEKEQLLQLMEEGAHFDDGIGRDPSSQLDEAGGSRPIGTQLWQEQEILRVIRDLGYDPLALPKNPPGKSGVPAKVRDSLKWEGERFKKAWERVSADKKIRYAP